MISLNLGALRLAVQSMCLDHSPPERSHGGEQALGRGSRARALPRRYVTRCGGEHPLFVSRE
jgi:hypothetical protein